ncbi:MAG: hypothetical protein K2J99_13725 [Lachnospiraceae bacterium]|nr:hypothetical protein [Lachnospiraceae bacterium]
MSNEKRQDYLNHKRPYRAEWVLVILAGMILGSFYLYSDITDTSACGVKLWNALTQGRFSMFYYEEYYGAAGSILEYTIGGSYDFALYLIFALYNFPLWVWEKITGFSFMQFIWTREYIKGIIWIFSGISAYMIYKIARICDLDEEEAKWGAFLFVSSAIFFYAEVITSGYDILSVAFTLLGIYFYMKKNNKGFVLSFAVAIAMKMFAVWIFIPLVLLKEKRLWRILVYGIESISVIAIPKIYFALASHRYMINRELNNALQSGGQAYADSIKDTLNETTGYATNEILAQAEGIINDAIFPEGRFLEYTYISMNALPLVFVGMFALWLFCYLYKKELNNRKIIYVCTVAMSIFILTVKIHPYWAIILVPYLVLIIMFHPERMKDNLILEGVFAIGYVLNKAITYYWTCGLNMIEQMTRPQHRFSYGSSDMESSMYGFYYFVVRLSEKIGISATNIGYVFKAASVAGLVMFLIWNCPWMRQETVQSSAVDYKERRRWLYTRFVISCMVGMLPFLGLIVYLM